MVNRRVSCRKGQSIIEYLIIVAAIIGVVLIARTYISGKVGVTYNALADKAHDSISEAYGLSTSGGGDNT